MNKGRAYRIPGVGLAGDWPGGWTQTYAQIDTEAGAHGFDKDYFVQQVAGLSQLAGEFMLVKPLVIDLGWGTLKSALVGLQDSGLVAVSSSSGGSGEGAAHRQKLVNQFVAAFRHVEAGAVADAGSALHDLAASISALVVPDQQQALRASVDGLLAKLA
jgi:hypothetical protein